MKTGYKRIDFLVNGKECGFMGSIREEHADMFEIWFRYLEGFYTGIWGTYYFNASGWKLMGAPIVKLLRERHLPFRVSIAKGKALFRNEYEVMVPDGRRLRYKYRRPSSHDPEDEKPIFPKGKRVRYNFYRPYKDAFNRKLRGKGEVHDGVCEQQG